MLPDGYECYAHGLRRWSRRYLLLAAVIAVFGGYVVSIATSILIGVAATLALFISAEFVWAWAAKETQLRRFPELRNLGAEWRYHGILVRFQRYRVPRRND